MQEWVDSSSGIPAVLLAFLLLIAVSVMRFLCSRKSNKAREEEFRRLQRVAIEEQARAEAEWEEESKRLKQSDISRAERRRRGAALAAGVGGESDYRKQTESEAKLREDAELEAVNRRKQAELEAANRKRAEDEANIRKQVELEAADRKWAGEESHIRKQAEFEIEHRKQAENEAADRRRQAEEKEAKSRKMAEEEAAYLQQRQKGELETNPQNKQEVEAEPRIQAEELANRTKSVDKAQQQQQREVPRAVEPKKKQQTGAGRYVCIVCGKSSKGRCKQCKRVHYCSTECQRQHWFAVHKFECHDLETGSPGSLDTDSRTFSEVPSPGSSRSENHKVFADFTDTSNVNEVGPPAQVLSNPDGPTLMQQKLPSSTVISDGQQRAKLKKVFFPYDEFMDLFDWDMLKDPPCGLINCGNSCFANVVLQSLYHIRPLTAFFLEGGHGKSCMKRDWCFMCELQKHVQKATGNQIPFSPINILSRIRKIGSHLGYGRQEDAHEFMRFSIDLMQMICVEEVVGEKSLDDSIQETTLIHHIFGGRLQSQVKCIQCLHESNRYEPMMDLLVDIQGNVKSLEDALAQLTDTELLDGANKYKCDRCNSYVKAQKRLTVHEAPNILTVALKRFQGGKFGKLNKLVAFPEALNLVPYMSGKGDKPPLYHLFAVVVHVGILASDFGHYICYVKNSLGIWYKVDDRKVKEVELHEVTSQRAYMLFYSRAYVRPAPVTEDGGFTVQQSNESSKGTVRFERQRSSLYSLRASPEALDLVRSLPHDPDSNGWHGLGNGIQHNGGPGSGFDEQNYVDGDSLSLSSGDTQPMSSENGVMPSGSDSDRSLSPSEHLASGIRPRVNSNKLISIPHNSRVVFQQSLSGRLEHSYSFQLSHQPLDVMDENQQPWSGQVVKKRLFKGLLPYALFSKPLQKVHPPAFPSGSYSWSPHAVSLGSSSGSACSVLEQPEMQSPEKIDNFFEDNNLWEEFFSVQAHHQHTDSCSNICSVVDPKLLWHLEANSSQQLEINEAGRVEDSGMSAHKVHRDVFWRMHPGVASRRMDFCCSKSGVAHTFWTPGDQNAKEFEKNAEAITRGD